MARFWRNAIGWLWAWWTWPAPAHNAISDCKSIDMIRAAAGELATAIEDAYEIAWGTDDLDALQELARIVNDLAERIIDLGERDTR